MFERYWRLFLSARSNSLFTYRYALTGTSGNLCEEREVCGSIEIGWTVHGIHAQPAGENYPKPLLMPLWGINQGVDKTGCARNSS